MSENTPSEGRVPPDENSSGASTVTDPQSRAEHDVPIAPGRPVILTPTPSGFRRLLLGSVIALLAPLFGILIGSSIGRGDSFTNMQPMYWGFFVGGLIGGAALLVAASGALALWRDARARSDTPAGDEEER